MLRRDTFSPGEAATEFKDRFDARLNFTAKSVPLMIQRVQLSDSAVYYCALRSTCSGDHVQQQPGGVIATEGGLVTLSCQYNTSANNVYLYWYKQEANYFPKYMLSRYSYGSEDTAAGFKERFNASLNAKTQSVPLTIQGLQLSDSALYYCALRPTVTTGYTAPLQKHCVCMNTILILAACYFGEEAVDQQSGHVTALEGGLVTLSCNYTTSSPSSNLFWYIQLTRDSPQYVLRRDRYSEGSNSDEFKERFDSRLNVTSSSVPLMIQRLQLSDSAVYYCALKPTVTTGDSVTVHKLRVECCSDNVTSFSMFDDTQKEEETRSS
ncbi:unnamed protein product [Coregonus sp. 'balchen']|nr:unnamed protein product [Coregonus sp. 'balchen']